MHTHIVDQRIGLQHPSQKRAWPGVVLAVLTSLLGAGCQDEKEGYGIDRVGGSGIVPSDGAYTFSARGVFSVEESTSGKVLKFGAGGGRLDAIPIENGAFYYEWGQIGGTHCPTDGYAISGRFVSATQAEGNIAYAFACKVTDRVSFTAIKR